MRQTNFSYYTFSEKASHHENEDFVAVDTHFENYEMLLCALADGQGGQRGGAIASKLSVEKTIKTAKKFSAQKLYNPTNWISILVEADRSVYESNEAGFTTLIGFCFFDGVISGASCGDSQVLYVNDSQSILLTENQRKNPPVGSSGSMPTPFSAKLESNWKIIAMSDGVWKFLDWELIQETARNFNGNELIEKLRTELLNRYNNNFPDDFTILLIQN